MPTSGEGRGVNEDSLVELRGLEPLTPTLPAWQLCGLPRSPISSSPHRLTQVIETRLSVCLPGITGGCLAATGYSRDAHCRAANRPSVRGELARRP